MNKEPAVNNRQGSILVADDDDNHRHLLVRQLKHYGHTVTEAHNGEEALQTVRQKMYDLVLLDMDMPGASGDVVLKQIKADIGLRHIPVIMISGMGEFESVVKCIKMGAADYLPKPFNPILLKARIDACLENKFLRDQEMFYLEKIQTEKQRQERLLHAIFPTPIVEELKATNQIQSRRHEKVAVLFCDIVGFTNYCEIHEPEEIVFRLQKIVEAFEKLCDQHGMQKIKTIGDAFMAAAGLLTPSENPVLDCIQCGFAMIEVAKSMPMPTEVRIGVHFGPVIAGVIGHNRYLYDIWGDTVNTAARIQLNGIPNKIVVCKTDWEHISEFCLGESLGKVPLKGKGDTEIIRVDGLRTEG
jgi:class 3 adenylate cyclase